MMSYVLARGTGGVDDADREEGGIAGIVKQLPDSAASEVLAEYERRIGIAREDDQELPYWPAFASTRTGPVVAFLGERELKHSEAVNFIGLPVTCCIFGTKINDWPGWTLVSPLHVWLEPTDG